MKKIIFVCTGNTCRSPMAEAFFKKYHGDELGWEASSAGLCAIEQEAASMNSIEVMRERDIDLSSHRSCTLTTEQAIHADLIVTMTADHRDAILSYQPELADKVFLIKSFGTSKVAGDVSDPFGGSTQTYRRTRDEIDHALSDLILFLRRKNS